MIIFNLKFECKMENNLLFILGSVAKNSIQFFNKIDFKKKMD